DDEYSGVEDIELVATSILLNDFDVDEDSFEIILVSAPSHGAMFLDVVTGIFSYQPDADWSGVDTFTYQLYDGSMYSNLATVTLTISSVNDVPVSEDDDYEIDEDMSLTILTSDLLANDYDVDGDTLIIQIESVPSFGTFDILAGEFVYTPNPDWSGPDSFTYRVFDGSAFGNLATVTITVNAVNDAPVATDDAYSGFEDLELVENTLLSNDLDLEGDSLEIVLVSGPTHGTLNIYPDGSFAYLPDLNWFGVDSFTYQAYDGQLYSNEATVTLTIESVNDVPIVVEDYFLGMEDSVLWGDVLANDYDVEWDDCIVYLVDDALHGTVDIHSSSGVFSYIPNPDWFGMDYFTYNVYDGHIISERVIVTLEISPVNDVPIAYSIAFVGYEDVVLYETLPLGFDVDGDALEYILVTDPLHGVLSLDSVTGAFSYTPDVDWFGPDSFEYHVFDGEFYSDAAVVTIEILQDDDITGPEIAIMYIGDGTDGAPGTWTVTVVDPESGVDWITVEIDGVLVGTTAGVYPVPNTLEIHTITVTAANADFDFGPSDQETSTLSDSIAIVDDDVTGPSILITYVGEMTEGNPGYWTVTISDAESDIYSIVVEIDGVVVGTLEGDYAVPGLVGDYTITVTAINNDLDREDDQETSVLSDMVTIVDVVPPETSFELSGTMGLNGWYISDVTVTLTVNEEATTAYSINGGPWLSYVSPFVVGLEGDVTVSYNSTDTAGNTEVTKEISFRIDVTPPDLDYDTDSIPGEGILVTIITSDSFSGLGDVEYSLDGDIWLLYDDPFLLSEEGMITVHFRATDLAGNSVAMTVEIEVIIEILTPPTELTYSGDDSGVYSDPVYLEALLLDGINQLPVPGKTILFTLGTQHAYAVTNADGLASVIIILDQDEGVYELTISFAGDDDYLASSSTSEFVIYRECASAIYSGITIIEVSEESISLMATVFDDADGHWGDITHIYVTFVFYLPSDPSTPVHVTYPVRVQTTAVVGVGLVTLEIPNLPEGDYLVLV
ncbi:MAG: tandem-95 repeat protein, partial [Candidatus Thorarchaeota archaeon]